MNLLLISVALVFQQGGKEANQPAKQDNARPAMVKIDGDWTVASQLEPPAKRTEQVDVVAGLARGQPAAPRTHDVENEPQPALCRI